MNVQEKAIEATKKYLAMKDYEDITEFEGYVTAIDDGYRVICRVSVCEEEFGGVRCEELREMAESVAIRWLAQNEAVDVPLRFDDIRLIVVGNDRAMLRHHVNCLGTAI